MADSRDAMLAREMPKGHGSSSTISSSGSSGLPIQVTSNRLTVLAANANRWRAHRWHDLDWSKIYTARASYVNEAAWPHGQSLGRWGPSWHEGPQGNCFRLNQYATAPEALEFITRTGTAYYSAGTKAIHAMALEAERLGIEARIECFFTHGEPADEMDREVLKRVFGARVPGALRLQGRRADRLCLPCRAWFSCQRRERAARSGGLKRQSLRRRSARTGHHHAICQYVAATDPLRPG